MPASKSWLLCRVRSSLCALPLAHVIEVMRPLPLTPIADAPECVLGMCVMRGVTVPVVDAARCALGQPGEPTRFVAVRAGGRCIALAVDTVEGTMELADDRMAAVPALLSGATAAVHAVAARDTEFLLLLQLSRLLPELALSESLRHAEAH